jgi:hypothetical protein
MTDPNSQNDPVEEPEPARPRPDEGTPRPDEGTPPTEEPQPEPTELPGSTR